MAVHIKSLQQAHEDGLTAGVVHANGALRTRLEIDEFIKQKDMANLYILALISLQKLESWKDRFSWFQMAGELLQARHSAANIGLTSAGIHGKPFVPWDEVHPDQTTTVWDYLDRDAEGRPRFQPNHASGYCSHSSNLFPTWHRKLAP